MCDTSDVVVETMMGRNKDKVIHIIYHPRKIFNEVQENYTTRENELFAVVFEMEKYRSYCLCARQARS